MPRSAAAQRGAFQSIVTAPVQKSIINEAGVPFTGHTEYLAKRTGVRLPVMLLVGGGLRVALATTHLPLRKVSAAITPSRLGAVLRIVASDLRTMFANTPSTHSRAGPESARG